MRVLRGGTLIDGTGAAPVRDATIVLRDGRIESVATGAGSWAADAEVRDVTGQTILPGLIDCHDHLAFHTYALAHRWGPDEPWCPPGVGRARPPVAPSRTRCPP